MSKYHELRILLPLSLSEYEVGHIYTRYKLKHNDINKRSQTDVAQCSTYPSSTSSLGHGVYTHHVHLFNGILPQWAITMLNGSKLKIHGKTWDEYPYIVSRYELPSIARANVQIEFLHIDRDRGDQHNAFQLSPSQLSQRTVEYWNIYADPLIQHNGLTGTNDDPAHFRYESKCEEVIPSRGPLISLETDQAMYIDPHQHPPAWLSNNCQFMCVYVLLSASFDLPLQVLRNHAVEMCRSHFTQVVVELHRLAYVWMNEWDQFVIQARIENKNRENNGQNTLNSTQSKYSSLLQLFMKDATVSDITGGGVIPQRPQPIQQQVFTQQTNQKLKSRFSKKAFLQAKL